MRHVQSRTPQAQTQTQRFKRRTANFRGRVIKEENDQNTWEKEIDLTVIWQAIRNNLRWILATALVFGIASYVLSKRLPLVYVATADLISANEQGQDGLVNSSATKAPPLPTGALPRALQSLDVVESLIQKINASTVIPQEKKGRITSDLIRQMRGNALSTVVLEENLNLYGSGIYTVRATAESPAIAEELANLTANALLTWDRNRAIINLQQAKERFDAQLAQIDDELKNSAGGSIQQSTLRSTRNSVQRSLTQISILENSTTGSLTPLSRAIAPIAPVAPRPTRSGVLAAIFGLLVSSALVGLRGLSDRTIRTEDDLMEFDYPTLALLPKVQRKDILLEGMVRAARKVGVYESIGFLRVNVMSALKDTAKPVLMVTSSTPGEGKSTVTAALADGFANSGLRVLVIDADLRRGTQETVWAKYQDGSARTTEWAQLVGHEGVRTTREALIAPYNVQVLRVDTNIDVMPAGPGTTNTLELLQKADLPAILQQWKENYDVVLVDSAPLLAMADGLLLGRVVDGTIIVAGARVTHINSLKGALRRAERGGLKILGFVINKADARDNSSYEYYSAYSAR